jgi:transcriptional regulator with XRE-family HTH domain
MARSKTTTRNPIGPAVRRLRQGRGLTQKELAEDVGCADETISRIERGRLVPSVELASALAQALNVAMEELQAPGDRKVDDKLRQSERRLLAAVRDLDDAQVDDVVRALRLLLGVGRRPRG